jgi:hypothetical protein
MNRIVKNALAVMASVCLVIGMQGFAIGGFSGQASADSAKVAHLGVDPVMNALWLAAGWGLLSVARYMGRRREN